MSELLRKKCAAEIAKLIELGFIEDGIIEPSKSINAARIRFVKDGARVLLLRSDGICWHYRSGRRSTGWVYSFDLLLQNIREDELEKQLRAEYAGQIAELAKLGFADMGCRSGETRLSLAIPDKIYLNRRKKQDMVGVC